MATSSAKSVASDRPSCARTVAIGVFGDVDVSQVDDLESEDEAELLSQQHQRVRALAVGGVAHLLAALRQDRYQQRALARVGGERLLTDIEHIGELLHQSTRGRSCSPTQVAAAFKNCDRVPLIAQQVRR